MSRPAAVVLAIALSAGLARAEAPCDTRPLTTNDPALATSWTPVRLAMESPSSTPPQWAPDGGGQDPGPGALGDTPEARWTAAHDRAVTQLEAVAVNCTAAQVEEVDLIQFVGLHPTPTAVEALKAYAQHHPISSALLGSVIATTGAFPAHVPVQVGLSQVVTNGQPAVQPTIAGTPARKAATEFWRHFSLAGSGLLVTPASASPVLASFDLSAAVSNQPSPDDWLRAVNQHLDADEQVFAELSRSATAELLTRFKNGKRGTPAEKKATFAAALSDARAFYWGRAMDHFNNRYVKDLANAKSAWNWAATGRFRGTPDATYVPELPDLLSGGLEGVGRFDVTDGSFGSFSFSGSLALAYSGYPSKQFSTWRDIGTKPDVHGFRGDLNLGLSVQLKSGLPNVPGPRLTALAAGRLLVNTGTPDGSVGASVLLEVPVSANVALVGSLIARCNRTKCDQTSSFTLAVSKLN